jgi:hypothetical protein
MESVLLFFTFCCLLIACTQISARFSLRIVDDSYRLSIDDLTIKQTGWLITAVRKRIDPSSVACRRIQQTDNKEYNITGKPDIRSINIRVHLDLARVASFNRGLAKGARTRLPTIDQPVQIQSSNFPITQLDRNSSWFCESSSATPLKQFDSCGQSFQHLPHRLASAQQQVLTPEKNAESSPPERDLVSSSGR